MELFWKDIGRYVVGIDEVEGGTVPASGPNEVGSALGDAKKMFWIGICGNLLHCAGEEE